jgi:predicted MFS family arabinose efflux permease
MAQFAGIALGGWLGGLAADRWGWRTACYTLGGFGMLYCTVVGRGLRGLPAPAAARSSKTEPLHMPLTLFGIGGCFFLVCAMLWMLYAWLPDAIHSRFSLDLASSGLNATLVLQLTSMAGLLAGGATGDWARRRWNPARAYLVAIGLLLSAPFAWLCFSASHLPVLWFAEAGFGLTSGLMLSNVIAGSYDLVSESHYGITAGLMTLVGGLGGGLATLAAGAWLTQIPPQTLMFWTAAEAAAAAVLLAFIVNRGL